MEFEDIHTHPGGGMPPVKGKDLRGAMPATYAEESDNLQASADTEQEHPDDTAYTTIKQIKILIPGKVRTKFDIKKSSTGRCQAKIFTLNDTIEYDSDSAEIPDTYGTKTNDFDVVTGDLITIQANTNFAGDNTVFIRNFRVYFDIKKSGTDYQIITD